MIYLLLSGGWTGVIFDKTRDALVTVVPYAVSCVGNKCGT